ncbi:calpain small subunit 1-like [Vespa mandarinia]|uniref:calpain small subunit 1-like n=1 Tax=Vespa mandarinia TaxID=7446 RepID=UPI00160B36C1|nr:calpain small subunit 1-like [Vespa mandarinia]
MESKCFVTYSGLPSRMVQCRGETGVQGTATSSVATLDVLRGNLEKTFFGLFGGESAKVTLLLGGLLGGGGGGGGGAINGGGGGVGNEIAGDSPAELSE